MFDYYTYPSTQTEVVAIVCNSIALIILLFSVGFLTIWQIMYATTNTTTIEGMENSKIEGMVDRGKVSAELAVFPYDLRNWRRNVEVVFGTRWYLWWFPFGHEVGHGLSYESKFDEDYEWPPKAYLRFRLAEKSKRSPEEEDSELEFSSGGDDLVEDDEHQYGKHVRRGSEGYEVRDFTEQERQERWSGVNDCSDDETLHQVQIRLSTDKKAN